MNSTRVKICGLTRAEDANLAASLGAWALGFVFYDKSPRAIPAKKVRDLLSSFPSQKSIGVFVNSSIEEILNAVEISGVNTVQLHGDESPEFCKNLQNLAGKWFTLIKALRPKNHSDLSAIAQYNPYCEAVLLDTFAPDSRGGTGLVGDWKLAATARELYPHTPLILAGGLHSENALASIEAVRPYALDVSSGVETAAGIKSTEKLQAFFNEIHRTCPLSERPHS